MTARFPRQKSSAVRACAVLLLTAVLSASGISDTGAQSASSAEIQSLLQRIERLQRDMNTLQRQVYRGERPPASAAPSPIGPEVAPNLAAAMQVRMDELESQLRSLTGRVEETGHALNELAAKVEALTSDLELRFNSLQSAPPQAAAPQGGQAPASAAPSAASAPSPQGVLGTLSLDDVGKSAGGPAQSAAVTLPKGSAEEQYRFATAFLARSDWGGAERALTAFLQAHPDHALSGNAQYWLGETHYVRGDFGNAALAFAKGYKDYPKSQKGPDNLLKLGLALANLKKVDSACTSLDRVPKDFPTAPPAIKSRAEAERKKLGCR